MEKELVEFFEAAIYMVPDAVTTFCKRHVYKAALECPCVGQEKRRYSLSLFTSKQLPRRVFFELSRFHVAALKWRPFRPRPVEPITEIWDRELLWCRSCLQNGTVWRLIDHYNGTGIKEALPDLLSVLVPVQELVALVNGYLPVGKEVELACWDCIEASS